LEQENQRALKRKTNIVKGLKRKTNIVKGLKRKTNIVKGLKRKTNIVKGLKRKTNIVKGLKRKTNIVKGLKRKTNIVKGYRHLYPSEIVLRINKLHYLATGNFNHKVDKCSRAFQFVESTHTVVWFIRYIYSS
jgi:hypothetical protein